MIPRFLRKTIFVPQSSPLLKILEKQLRCKIMPSPFDLTKSHDNNLPSYSGRNQQETEEKYATLVANIPGAVYRCIYDEQWTITFLSDAIFDISGYPPSDFIGNSIRSLASIIHPLDQAKIRVSVRKSIEAQKPYILEYRIFCADGSIRWVYEKGQGIYQDNKLVYLDGVILDITDRKRMEEHLRSTQEFLREVIQNIPVAVFIKDATEQKFIDWNSACEDLLGYPKKVVIGKNYHDLFPPHQADELGQEDSRIIHEKMGIDLPEKIVFTPHRGERIFHIKKVPLLDELENTQYILGMAEDITERQQTEKEIARLALVAQKTQNAVIITNTQGQIEWVNEGFVRITGYYLSEVQGKKPGSFLQGNETNPQTIKAIRQAIKTLQPFDGEIFNYKKDGKGYWLSISITPIYHPNTSQLQGFIAVESDITARKKAEEALRESESHYRYIVETASEGVWMFDAESRTVFANNRIAEMLGSTPEEMLGKSLFNFIDPDNQILAENYVERRRQGIQERHDFKFIRQDGSHLWAIVSATPIFNSSGEFSGVLRMITDISDRKKVEEALRDSESQLREKNQELAKALQELQQTHSLMVQNEKMVSLGQLVAGVAHEINNPVSFIYGNISHANEYFNDLLYLINLYQQEYPVSSQKIQDKIESIDLDFILEDLPNLLTSMKVGAERICQIVLSLKNFSRLDESEQKQVDIHQGLESTLLILQHRLKETPIRPKIHLLKDYGDLPLIQCYPGELNQVFMNIISNGIDALEEAIQDNQWQNRQETLLSQGSCPFPSISITTFVKYAADNPDKISHIVIRIADNGLGIPLPVQQRLFDPFFTTKPVGQGTGLGLSISYKIIVEKHKGQLKCISQPGEGAKFIIEIPIE